ncbi:hypothetical protein DCAR_0209473 [Daucus carota subsp. sativus]|uniref:Uncharacterized protein n=1 Tax=Daucus carota subsp. sativus TaxID=79200 RepID=A0A166FAE8_DAUCS|nr:hypothetical protein DCAR_0209473 [Daucus carota subsp. sativus]
MRKKTSREDYVVTTPGISWRGISVLSLSPSVSSSVVFRVDVATAVRFAECFTAIKSKRLEVMAWCDVEVDQLTGKKVSKKDIKLKHLIVDHISGWLWFACFIIVILALLSPFSGCCWVALFPELLG